MKLRNKKTGEIIELLAKPSFVKRNDDYLQSEVNTFNSLAELNAEWEDYEEPEGYWFIDCDGEIEYGENEGTSFDKDCKAIGNYFETKEEAEKAVEKLKAWKRLKDKGFRFDGYNACSVDYDIDEQYRKYISQDLDLLFGGEE